LPFNLEEILIAAHATTVSAPRDKIKSLRGRRKFDVTTMHNTITSGTIAFREFFCPQASYDGCMDLRWFLYSSLSTRTSHMGHRIWGPGGHLATLFEGHSSRINETQR
jgi:hypothetical protein